jgi:metal-responsive CopG/Arc/MetJ family transcriptional regulator
MKAKVSLTLSADLLQELDQMAGRGDSRSSFIEKILRSFVAQRAQRRRLAREVAAINEHAAKLNAEMSDALSFQTAVD